jgi:hypothetical protein
MMAKHENNLSLRNAAIIGSIAYFIMFVAAIFSNFIVREKLILFDNLALTIENILNNEMLFRASIFSDFLFVLPFDILLALMLYVFFKPVNKSISLLAAWFRIIYTVIYAIALLFLTMVLPQVNGFVGQNEENSLSVFCLKAFDITWLIGLLALFFLVFIYASWDIWL